MSKSIVLMFHEIHDEAWFEEILRVLGRKYKYVSFYDLRDMLIKKNYVERIAHITFDDGHKSIYTKAFPVLKKLGLPSTLFVSPQVIEHEHNYWFQRVRSLRSADFQQAVLERSKDFFNSDIKRYSIHSILKSLPYYVIDEIVSKFEKEHSELIESYMNVSREELIEMSDSGLVEIGAHTVNHPILVNESDKDSAYEINESIKCLSRLVNKQIRAFAYPNGQPIMDFGQREMKIVSEAGIELAFSTESSSIYDGADPMSIPRIGISKGNPYYVTQKIRFAKQWIQMRNLVLKETELTERKKLLRVRTNTFGSISE